MYFLGLSRLHYQIAIIWVVWTISIYFLKFWNWKLEMRVPAWLGFGNGPSPASSWPPFACVLSWQKVDSPALWPPLMKASTRFMRPPKGPSSKYHHIWTHFQHPPELAGEAHQSIAVFSTETRQCLGRMSVQWRETRNLIIDLCTKFFRFAF